MLFKTTLTNGSNQKLSFEESWTMQCLKDKKSGLNRLSGILGGL